MAKLAGVPKKVVTRAKQILKELENGDAVTAPRGNRKKEQEETGQITFTPDNQVELLARLKAVDVNALTPIECMNLLFELHKLANL